jgi:hypothetical protein
MQTQRHINLIRLKKAFLLSQFLLILSISFAEKRYWISNTESNWNNVVNWATTSGGGSGASVPSTNDTVVFDQNGVGSCLLDIHVATSQWVILSGYTGEIIQNNSSLTITDGGFLMQGGSFKGGTAEIDITGSFILELNAFFQSTADNLIVRRGNLNKNNSAIFNHNNGNVIVRGLCSQSLAGEWIFNNFDVSGDPSCSSHSYLINVLEFLTVYGELKITSGNQPVVLNEGQIDVFGDITIENLSTDTIGGGSATINIRGTNDQILTGSGIPAAGKLPNINIDKPSGSLILKGIISIGTDREWKYTQGHIDIDSFDSRIVFTRNNIINGSHILKNVEFRHSSINTLTTGTELTIKNVMLTTGNGFIVWNGGQINLLGDLEILNTSVGSGGGSTIINVSGSDNQEIKGTTTLDMSRLPSIKINKPSGLLYLKDIISVGGNWEYVSGEVDAVSKNSTIVFRNIFNHPLIDGEGVDQDMIFNHIYIYDNKQLNGNLTVEGNLIINGNFNSFSYNLFLKGNIENNGTFNTGDGTVYFDGNSSILGANVITFNNIHILNEANLTAHPTNFKLRGNFNVLGNFYPLNGTVVFEGSNAQFIEKEGSEMTFYNLNINKSAEHITLLGKVEIQNELLFNSGNILTSDSFLLTFLPNSFTTNVNNNSFVSGPVKKIGNTSFAFPVGKSGVYQPITISSPSFISDVFVAEYFDNEQLFGNNLEDNLLSISSCEYWTLNRVHGSSSVNVTLGWNSNSCDIPDDMAKIRVAGWDGDFWQNLGNKETSGNLLNGHIKSLDFPTHFNHYVLGTSKSLVPINEDDNIEIGLCGYDPKKELYYNTQEARDSIMTAVFSHSHLVQIPCGDNFVLTFDDHDSGFDDPILGEKRRDCACEVFKYIESVIDINLNGTDLDDKINFIFYKSDFPASSAVLAYAGAFQNNDFISLNPGIYGGNVHEKITTGNDPDEDFMFDGYIRVNFEYNFQLCNSSNYDCRYDLFSIILHEIGHSLGILSFIGEDVDLKPVNKVGNNRFTIWDSFIHYGEITTGVFEPLLQTSPLQLNNNTDFSGVLRSGKLWTKNAGMYNNNQPVYSGNFTGQLNLNDLLLYPASLVSHLDAMVFSYSFRTNFSPGYPVDFVMNPTFRGGKINRVFSIPELRVFVDLGYSINPMFSDYNTIVLSTPPYTIKTTPSHAYDTYPDMIETPDYTITNDGTPLAITLNDDPRLIDNEEDVISVEPNTLFNIRGCGDGNNHDRVTINADGTEISYLPRPDFIGRAQFGFYLWDGKERGSFMSYTIDVLKGNSFLNHPNSNTPTGQDELIINGDFEQGTEIKTFNSNLEQLISYSSQDYGHPNVVGEYFAGVTFSDANPLLYTNHAWTWGYGGVITRKSFKQCNPNDVYVNSFGVIAFNFPNPFNVIYNTPLPHHDQGDRYHYLMNRHNYFTLSEEMIPCENYILTFDVNFRISQHPIGSEYTLKIGFTETADTERLYNYLTEKTIVIEPDWNKISIPLKYCGNNPSFFLNLEGTVGKVLIDNISLVVDPSPPVLTVDLGSDVELCQGESILLNAEIANESCDLIYNWSPAEGLSDTDIKNPTVSPLNTTTYTITVTNSLGCEFATDQITIIVNPLPDTEINHVNTLCLFDNPITLTTSGESGGTWSGIGIIDDVFGVFDPTVAGAGAHTVFYEITDVNGCFNSSQLIIDVNEAPTISFTDYTNIVCFGESNGQATIVGTGGLSPYSFLWSTGETTHVVNNLPSGEYDVTITDSNNCFNQETFIVEEYLESVFNINTILACIDEENGKASVEIISGNLPTFLWSTGETTQTITGLSPGTYSLDYITLPAYCVVTRVFTISENTSMSVMAFIEDVNCVDNSLGIIDLSISGGISPYTYLWSNGATTKNINNLHVGNYEVTITDNIGCRETFLFSVEGIESFTSQIDINDISCFGNSDAEIYISITGGTSPYSFIWDGGQTTTFLTGLHPGTYSVTIEDAIGCFDVQTIDIIQPNILEIGETIQDISCYGQSTGNISITVEGGVSPYTYQWSNNETTETNSGLIVGVYTVTVIDANNCVLTDNYIIEQSNELVLSTVLTEDILCYGQNTGSISLTVTGGITPYSYQWSNNETTETNSGLTAGVYTVTVTDANNCVLTDNYIIEQSNELVLSTVLTEDILCYGQNTGSISLTVTGGITPYSYQWSNNETTETNSGLTAGVYTVTVTDANNCVLTDNYIIEQSNELVLSTVLTEDILCYGQNTGSISITVEGGVSPYTYQWSNNETTETNSGLIVGVYTVTVIDANNCVLTDSYIIEQPNELAISTVATEDISCYGQSTGSISITVEGGVSPYSYQWSNNETTETNSGLTAGVYTVTVTDANNCVLTDNYIIEQSNELVLSTVLTEDILCYGQSTGSISIAVEGGTSPYTYQWSNNETTATNSGLTAGVYTVTVTDANNCVLTDNYIIEQSNELVLSTVLTEDILCYGQSTGNISITVEGGVSPYTYQWSNNETTETISGLNYGAYTVTITDDYICSIITSITISEASALSVQVASIKHDCPNTLLGIGNATLEVVGGQEPYQYQWNDVNNQTTATAVMLNEGTYIATITDANNCSTTTPVIITVTPFITNILEAFAHPSCFGSSDGFIDFNVGGGIPPYTFIWSNGATTEDIDGLSGSPLGTIYALSVIDNNDCQLLTSFPMIEPLPISILVSITDILCSNNTTSIVVDASGGTGAKTFEWSTNTTGNSLVDVGAGIYSVTATDINGCTASESFMITEPDLIVINGVTNANDCFGGISGSIITSVTGGISPYTYLWNNNATDASLSGLSAGIYTVTVIDDNNCTMSHAFVVEQPATLELLLTTSSIDCFGNQNGSITSVSSGGTPPYTFIWSNGATTTFINNLGANIYTLTVTDNNQCTAIASANITEPDLLEIQLVASSENCNTHDGYIEANVLGGVLPYTFLWSNGATTSSVSELSAGAYTLTLSDNNGCLLVQSIDVDAFPVYNTVATQIFGNVTWSSDMYIDQYIYVNFDAVLNINNGAHISFAPFAGIIVRPGGTLNVTNNAVLSGIIPCQKMWQGVTVEGNSLIAHPSYFNISHPDHGLIRITNATIRDARHAIYAGFMRRKSPFLPILSNTFGGIVLASNATFLNNIVAVKIDGELPKANRSSLNRCRFIYDHQAFYDAFALNNGVVFVSFDNSYGVKIAGCYFENEVLSTLIEQQRGYGILSNNAGFTVSRACNILSPIGGDGCIGDKNTFKGLSYGIYASGINSLRKRVEIDQAVFEENFRGIYLRGQQFPVVTRNTFKVGNLSYLPNLPLDMTNPYGLYLDYCDDYTIEENEFYNSAAQGSLYNTYGMVVRNTGAEANEIYRNVFHHSGIGMAAFGEPEHNSNEQLQIKCNDFTENIAISDFISGSTNSKIADPQGFCTPIPTTPAGNTFSYSSAALFWDFYAWDHRTVYKHHDLTLSNADIFPRQQVITPDECAGVEYSKQDACPTRFGGGGGGVIGIKDRIARNGEKLHEAQQLIDGGNTQQLLDLIVTGNAGQVKNTLLQYAPYLSNVVLITYVQSTPPAGNLKEVVLANAPVAEEVMETIIQQQLPKGIMNEINAMQTGVSPRKAVDEQISYYGGQWSMAISDLALHYLNDTLQNNLDSVIMVLQMEQGPGVQKQLAAAFTENKQFEEARQTIGNLDNDEFEIFKQVQKLLIDFDEQQIEYTNISISSDTVQSFWIYASDTTRKGYVEARGILQLLVDTVYFPEYFDPLPVFSGLAKMFDTTQPNNKAPKMAQTIVTDTITTYSLTNYPNPFTGGTTIQVESPAKGKIKVFDIMGRELMSIPTTEGIFITEINDHQLQQGTYYYSLIINNAVVLTKKMIKL